MQPNSVGALQLGRQQHSDECIARMDLRKSSSTAKAEEEAIIISCDGVRAKSCSNLHKHPTVAISVLDGKIVVLNHRKECILIF